MNLHHKIMTIHESVLKLKKKKKKKKEILTSGKFPDFIMTGNVTQFYVLSTICYC